MTVVINTYPTYLHERNGMKAEKAGRDAIDVDIKLYAYRSTCPCENLT